MDRREFLRTAGVTGVAGGIAGAPATAFVPAHNWDKYDFGSGPPITDRLNQGPFPQYPPEEVVPSSSVVMATTPSKEIVASFGRGLITYITADMGRAEIQSDNIPQAIEDLVRVPLGQKLYLRPTWREVQPRHGRLEFPDYWKLTFDLAARHSQRVAFRIQMRAPDYEEEALPNFVLEKVPMVKLQGEWKGNPNAARHRKTYFEPRYDHPAFQAAFEELNGLLAAELNGNPLVEFMDTFMYGFWGEGHTWPFTNNPFPDYPTAERTWINMFELQLKHWTKTPLVTNTQPDFSRVGNSEVVDRTVRSYNWLRTDTIFVENEQIEAISNRPPWIAAIVEVGMSDGSPGSLLINEGIPYTDNEITHVMDVGANYWSLWNFHHIKAEHIMNYYRQYPQSIDEIGRRIGYRVRPSVVWEYEKDGSPGLVIGFANDGIAGVPGVLRVTLASNDGKIAVGGSRIRNSRQLTLGEGTYPTNWAPDSKTILFSSNLAGTFATYKQSLSSGESELIATGMVGIRRVRVSPDGKWVITFLNEKPGGPSGSEQLMRIPFNGGPPELIFAARSMSSISCTAYATGFCVIAEMTEDGKQAVVTAFDPVKGRGRELARFGADPNAQERYCDCQISPDGTRIAVKQGDEGPIRILSLRGQPAQVIQPKRLNLRGDYHWAADGRGLYVSSIVNGNTALLHVDLQGNAHVVWENHGSNFTWGIPSPDGRHLAFLGSTGSGNMWMMENF